MTSNNQHLAEFRASLDSIDEEIVTLLGRRFSICRDVARYKKQNGVPMMQPGRVSEVRRRCAEIAAKHEVDPDFTRALYDLIIREACQLEDEIIGSVSV